MVNLELNDRLSNQEAVLGSLLIEPKLIGQVLDKVTDRDFLDGTYRQIFQAIREQFVSGKPVDAVTVRDKLGGGEAWSSLLLQIMDDTPTAANVWAYVSLMKEQARVVQGREIAQSLAEACELEDIRRGVDKLQALLVERQDVRRMGMEQMLQSFWERHTKPHRYMTWGLSKLDEQLFSDLGDMVVLGGYPSAGKTALAVSFAYHQSEAKRVGFYSLETGEAKLEDRLIAYNMRLDFGKVKRSELSEEDFKALSVAAQRLTKPDLEWVPASGMQVDEIRASALSRGYDAVFIDYLQLIQGEKGRTRYEEVTGISLGLHRMAQDTGITVVALSQLSRPEKGGDGMKAPTLASLRESGQIEQDADVVMLLYKETDTPDSRRVLFIAKNKEGEQGKIYLAFDGAHQRLYESAVDAPAPKPRREPEYKQVQFQDLPGNDPDDPFSQGGGA